MISGVEKSAGYIVDYLEWAEEASLSEIIEEVEVPQPVVLMGIGYLIKEGRVDTLD
ncbi:MAG: protein of unknown function, DUF2582, partial [Candidatus Nanosalina sp. J07AB43]